LKVKCFALIPTMLSPGNVVFGRCAFYTIASQGLLNNIALSKYGNREEDAEIEDN